MLDGPDNHSYAQITWLTGMEKKIYLHNTRFGYLMLANFIKSNNEICENQRNYEGHDDEPEDESATLL